MVESDVWWKKPLIRWGSAVFLAIKCGIAASARECVRHPRADAFLLACSRFFTVGAAAAAKNVAVVAVVWQKNSNFVFIIT